MTHYIAPGLECDQLWGHGGQWRPRERGRHHSLLQEGHQVRLHQSGFLNISRSGSGPSIKLVLVSAPEPARPLLAPAWPGDLPPPLFPHTWPLCQPQPPRYLLHHSNWGHHGQHDPAEPPDHPHIHPLHGCWLLLSWSDLHQMVPTSRLLHKGDRFDCERFIVV